MRACPRPPQIEPLASTQAQALALPHERSPI